MNFGNIEKITGLKKLLDAHPYDKYTDESRITLSDIEFKGLQLHSLDFRKVRFEDCAFVSCDLSRCDFFYASMRNCRFIETSFSISSLVGISFNNCSFTECTFASVHFMFGTFDQCHFDQMRLSHDIIDKTRFVSCNVMSMKIIESYINDLCFKDTDVSKIDGIHNHPMACPETGSFIGWKKADGAIIKLEIPEDAKRNSAFGRKCRCDKAVVLEIRRGDKNLDSAKSVHDPNFIYKVGETVYVDDFDEDRFHECAPGIHFFISMQEAIDYHL